MVDDQRPAALTVQIPEQEEPSEADTDWWHTMITTWGGWSDAHHHRDGYAKNRGFEVTWDPKAKLTVLTVRARTHAAALWLMMNPHPDQLPIQE